MTTNHMDEIERLIAEAVGPRETKTDETTDAAADLLTRIDELVGV